ncbi:MAG: anthranilate phosphoribosyltransferase [Thermobacillus sp. ZCTH02-B1]|uniref:anthranilate phosphoribosyltransferase n=1 Tax=Thermobacillus sp. ZCTH02-B1 TaxID=1858795 RepID=UPI000B54E7FC|nr:anthranilate phosphoribosyltransferase [Thermobacillus sp. ZCTH02-B1]OUM96778.1 MAG: anthranilate phosphoribosyltransferase [Thermobacillus sp. ZCTH02-B1]
MEQAVKGMTMQEALAHLIAGKDLSRVQAEEVMARIMDGEATPAQIAGVLTALRMKGETVDEIAGFAKVMREKSHRVRTVQEGLLDTCGTGGSGIRKFNVSTSSAIIAAAAGIRVAKHGNRAMSGKAGSADVLEALGVNIRLTPEQAAECLAETGICFLFAQIYHPSMKHAAGPRRELGVRTIFNLLGPLTNPAGADRQLLGLYDRTKTETIAEVLRELGIRRAIVAGSFDGLDEISISRETQVSELKDGEIRTYVLKPEDLGLERRPLEAVAGGTPEENAAIVRRVFRGEERGAYRDFVLANAGACIYLGGKAETLKAGVEAAAAVIDSGAAEAKLEELIRKTGEFADVS